MKTETLVALLGRPLSAVEATNKDLYLKIARESLEDLLCTSLCDQEDPKYFMARDGYRTVYTDVFTEIDEVKVDDKVVSNYSVKQWDRSTARWYNSIVFDDPLYEGQEVEVSASWGFNAMPIDLQKVWAELFDQVTVKNKLDPSIKSKRVEDFYITFDSEVDLDEDFHRKYKKTLSKYSLCGIWEVSHGRVRSDYRL